MLQGVWTHTGKGEATIYAVMAGLVWLQLFAMASIQVDVLITVSINTEEWWKHFATPSSTTVQFSPMMQSL